MMLNNLIIFIDEIFTIDEVHKARPNYYILKDHEGEKIEGRFYESELVKTKVDEKTTYRIEKVIRSRKKRGIIEYQVKFIGYPKLYWIKESDIEN